MYLQKTRTGIFESLRGIYLQLVDFDRFFLEGIQLFIMMMMIIIIIIIVFYCFTIIIVFTIVIVIIVVIVIGILY